MMKIGGIYSHLNGYEWILVHQPGLWKEIEKTIASVDVKKLKTKESKEIRMKGTMLYSPKAINATLANLFGKANWQEERTAYWVTSDHQLIRKTMALEPAEQKTEIESAGCEAIYSYNQTDFVKDRVAVEIQFGKYPFIAYDMFVKHLAFFVGDKIDVGVEIVPMKCMQKSMSSGIGYYESALYDLVRQGRGSPPVPLVLVGVEP